MDSGWWARIYRDEEWVVMWNKLRKWFECRGGGGGVGGWCWSRLEF